MHGASLDCIIRLTDVNGKIIRRFHEASIQLLRGNLCILHIAVVSSVYTPVEAI